MTCENVREQMSLYLDAQLSWQDNVEFENHINSCKKCSNELTELIKLTNRLKALPEIPLPDDFHKNLMENIKIIEKPDKLKSIFTKWKIPASIAAALLILFVFISLFNSIPIGTGSASYDNGSIVSNSNSMDYGYELKQTALSDIPESSPPSGESFSGMAAAESQQAQNADNYSTFEAAGDIAYDTVIEAEEGMVDDALRLTDEVLKETASAPTTNQKIIKTSIFSLEVDNFDETIEKLNNITLASGGYVENFSSNIMQNYINNERQYIELKSGSIILKIPAIAYENTKNALDSLGKVISQSENAQNITADYIDIEARLNVKQQEENRLLELMSKAEKVEDLILLEERLSIVRAEIESAQSKLKNWDKLVQYSTIDLYITEKETYQIKTTPTSLGSQISQGFSYSLHNTLARLEYIVITAAKNIVLITFIVIITLIILIIVINKNKKKKKRKYEES